MKALVAGWFSFEGMGATAGDLLTRDLACEWLEHAGRSYDVALASPFRGGVDWRAVDPSAYSHVVFVCGPFGNGEPVTAFLARFAGRRLVGVNLTMLQSLHEWNPFDLLLERDSTTRARPDLAFLSARPRVPVVGIVLIQPQPEYAGRDLHQEANAAIQRLVASCEVATVPIDTRLDAPNAGGLRTPAEIESLIAKMDVVATTRLHGLVLALKNGVPVVAVDPVAGGAKIRRQAEVIGWPFALGMDGLSDTTILAAFEYCLTEEARSLAGGCAERARQTLEGSRERFLTYFREDVAECTRPYETRRS
jgi:Polysaccharide pyruvyl transferase